MKKRMAYLAIATHVIGAVLCVIKIIGGLTQ